MFRKQRQHERHGDRKHSKKMKGNRQAGVFVNLCMLVQEDQGETGNP